jgi:adenylate cyclase
VPVIAPAATLLFSYAAVAVYMYLVEARARQAIRAAWQRRVAPEVLDVILRDPELAYVSGRRTVATTLFSDIRGFTTMCDALEPEGVVEMLNEYLTEMTKVIRKHRGTIHKFIGDGIMAVFGDPLPSDDHADEAVLAALEMHKRLQEMRATTQNPCIREMRIGVGIHTGELVAGDIGSEQFMEYTTIGRSVSVAARLESMNKDFGTGIIISAETRAKLGHEYEMTPLGPREIRGVADEIELYEIKVPERQVVQVAPLDEGRSQP